MPETYDVIVSGIGAMGGAACYHLARRNLRVLGIEQYKIDHDQGSSHGRSRVIRKAYFEDPRYVPLLHRTYEMWRELEKATDLRLLHLNGCLNLGPPDHECIQGAKQSAEEHGLPHEVLNGDEIKRRWPAFKPNESDIGIYEPDGGFLVPEQCVKLHVDLACNHGADIRTEERVLKWSAKPDGVRVETDKDDYAAKHLVITSGAWLGNVVSEMTSLLCIERQVQLWFEPNVHEHCTAKRMPVFIHFTGDRAFYGIPMLGDEGIKIGEHHCGHITTADGINRQITDEDEANVRAYLSRHMPDANGLLRDAEVCMYTNTPDDHFIVDRHPRHDNVLIAGGFSGHGFKFSPVVGQALSDLILDNATEQAIDLFSMNRTGLGQ
ncbi:MAG: N-methyl-L-tryptophan oxidase [Phycisphaerales bacterium]|nr:N-methyl-L-tryptophan oxidase [Phycisphaerales bacterium]